MEQSNTKNPGKMLSMLGLIIGIIVGIASIGILLIVTGWASFEGGYGKAIGLAIAWIIFGLVGLVLSLNGRKKSKAAGSKTGLGTFAVIVGILATISGCILVGSVCVVDNSLGKMKVYDSAATKAKVELQDEGQHIIDSMNAANDAASGATDTTKK